MNNRPAEPQARRLLNAPMVRRRIFVAVALAPALLAAVSGMRARLAEAESTLRWVPPENLHFTLKFLGGITPPQLAGVVAAAREVAARTQRFSIKLAGLGAFPSARRPRVVWVGVSSGADHLVALAEHLDVVLRPAHASREDRPFRPHLTIARVRDAAPVRDLSKEIDALRELEWGSQTVGAIRVMESHLRPSGAIYQPVEEVWLRGPA